MSTTTSELDRLASDVLEALDQTRSQHKYADAAKALFSRFAIKVSADNLRAWHVRRVAADLSERTPVDLRCDTDDYADAIRMWREERRTWASISKLLKEGFGFDVSEQALRGWWWRRKTRAEKDLAASAAVGGAVSAVVAAARQVPPTSDAAQTQAPAAAAPRATPAASPAAQFISRALPSETDVQRKIREKREQGAGVTSLQDSMLDRLAGQSAATEGCAP